VRYPPSGRGGFDLRVGRLELTQATPSTASYRPGAMRLSWIGRPPSSRRAGSSNALCCGLWPATRSSGSRLCYSNERYPLTRAVSHSAAALQKYPDRVFRPLGVTKDMGCSRARRMGISVSVSGKESPP
jgi:hypothetical protein